MADTLARLRRTALLLPRLMRAGAESASLSLTETAESLGTDVATLREDLHALQDIEFDSEDRPNYFGFEIDGDLLTVTFLPLMLVGPPHQVRLTEPEASALLGFLEELEIDMGAEEELEQLELTVARIAGLPEGVRSWSAGGPIPAEDVFTGLLTATREQRRCRISYTGSGGALYKVAVDPYHLRMERGLWYVITRLADGSHLGEERCYRIDKIAEIAVGEHFNPNPINLADYADGVFKPSGQAMVTTVVFSDKIAAYAEERWGPGRPVQGGVEIDVEYYDEGWLERTLALFGGEVRRP